MDANMSRSDALYWLRGHRPTEDDWLHCQDRFFQFAMLNHLRATNVPRAARGRRRLRLVACGLYRWPGIWSMLSEANRQALEEIERQAETGKNPNIKLRALAPDGWALARSIVLAYTVVSVNHAVHSAARGNSVDAILGTFRDVDNAWARNDHTPAASDLPGGPDGALP